MRRLAQELEVGTMSLYYYVKTKDDLIAAMDDALMAEALLPSLPKGWRRAITEIATRTHSVSSGTPGRWSRCCLLRQGLTRCGASSSAWRHSKRPQ